MSEIIFNQYPQFFTATTLEWKHVLANDAFKDIIIRRLQSLVKDGWVIIYGFTPIAIGVPNHIHSICQIQDRHQKASVQQSFLKYIAQQIELTMMSTDNKEVENYKVKASDRQYQFWERNPLSVDLWSRAVFLQKLNYMHYNPTQVHWELCQYPEEYKYSSAKFYERGINQFGFLSHYNG